MDRKLDLILEQKLRMERYADELQEFRLKLVRHKEALQEAWSAEEAETVIEALDRMDGQNRQIIEELYAIGQDILKAYMELEAEESNLGDAE